MYVQRASGLIGLNDACREAHEALAELVAKQIEERKASGVPLDDDTDFSFVAERAAALTAAAKEMDGAAAADVVRVLAQACSGGLRPLEPFKPSPEYDGIRVRLAAVTERVRIETRERLDAAATAADRHAVLCDYVAGAYLEVLGLEDDDGPVEVKREGDTLPAEAVAVLDAAGLIGDLWHVARRFAEVPASKKKRFGSPQPSTSASSVATAAPPSSAASSGATAEPPGATDSPTTSQTPVPAGTF